MAIALLATIVFGLIAILLSWEFDSLKKREAIEKKTQEDRLYKLSVLKDIQDKTAYARDIEKATDILMVELKNFFAYSVASSMVIKDTNVVFKSYVEEEVNSDYIDRIEESMLGSFASLAGNLPAKIDKRIHGLSLNNAVKSTYSSSFHIPLVVNNKVLALIHLSSTKENQYKEKDMEILQKMVEIAASSLTRFNQALDADKNILTSLLKSTNDGIFLTDNKNNLLFINDSAKRILGLFGEKVNFFDVINILKNLHLGSVINDVIVNNKSFIGREIQVGEEVLDVFINPVANYRASIVLHDVTEYKQKENWREDSLHVMIHELRAPLTAIKDSAELIISTKDTLEEEKKMKFLEIIHQQAKKILGQIGSILDTAKLDAGKLILQKTKGDIAKLVGEEIQIFMPQAERKNISLKFRIICKDLPLISFDSIRIAQVIENLLSNSLKFTPEDGSIKVEIDYRTIPPMGEFSSLDKYIVISVSDNGVGIAKEQQKFLFSKYTQAANTPERLTKLGTGLGLYVVKGLVEAHDGRVWVKSEPGLGTTISFTLPATDDSKESYDAPKPNPSPLSKLTRTVN